MLRRRHINVQRCRKAHRFADELSACRNGRDITKRWAVRAEANDRWRRGLLETASPSHATSAHRRPAVSIRWGKARHATSCSSCPSHRHVVFECVSVERNGQLRRRRRLARRDARRRAARSWAPGARSSKRRNRNMHCRPRGGGATAASNSNGGASPSCHCSRRLFSVSILVVAAAVAGWRVRCGGVVVVRGVIVRCSRGPDAEARIRRGSLEGNGPVGLTAASNRQRAQRQHRVPTTATFCSSSSGGRLCL